jgi:hypothetical protein
MVVTSLMVGFAPIFHALCIQPMNHSISSHVMADGSVMQIIPSVDFNNSGAPDQLSLIEKLPQIPGGMPLDSGEPLSLVALFIVPACLLLLGIFLALKKSHNLVFRKIFPPKINLKPARIGYFPNRVDSLALGISRT